MTVYNIGNRPLLKIGHFETAERNQLKYDIYAVNINKYVYSITNVERTSKTSMKAVAIFHYFDRKFTKKQCKFVKGGVKKKT